MHVPGIKNLLLYSVAALPLYLAGPAGAQNLSSGSEEVALLRSSDNEYEKTDLLRSMIAAYAGKGKTVPDESLETAIDDCLRDESPLVVEEAIRGIGAMKAKKYEPSLVALYTDARNRFGGYAERIRLAIIGALGKAGGRETSKLFVHILAGDNGTVSGAHTLTAVKTLNDQSLIPELKSYAEKMDDLAARGAAAGHDPMLYSMLLHNAQEARLTIAALGGNGGE